mgnify:CR=1 FL=1
MSGIYKSHMPSEPHRRNGRITMPLVVLVCITLFTQPARAGQTSTYGFVADRSTITQTGGIAGIHRTYTITGTFQLMLDFEAGTASFDRVDANAVDTHDPGER